MRTYKSKHIKDLEALAWEAKKQKHVGFPIEYLTKPEYSEKNANKLTTAIIDYLKLSGHHAERINTTGRYIDKKKVVSDCLGNKRTIGSGKWIPGTGQKGSADISATVNGKSVKIEVKFGADRQSEAQKEYQKQIEAAGGIYIIAKTFEGFINDLNNITWKEN